MIELARSELAPRAGLEPGALPARGDRGPRRGDVTTTCSASTCSRTARTTRSRSSACCGAAGKRILLRESMGDELIVRYTPDPYLDEGKRHIRVYHNTYPLDEVAGLHARSTASASRRIRDERTGDGTEMVVDIPHQWRILLGGARVADVADRRHDGRERRLGGDARGRASRARSAARSQPRRGSSGDGIAIGWTGAGAPNALDDERPSRACSTAPSTTAPAGGGRRRARRPACSASTASPARSRASTATSPIALHDRRDGTLWLARDRFGVRPLYYLRDAAGVRLRLAPAPAAAAARRVDARSTAATRALFAASHYRTFDNDPTRSPYVDVAQLPAGSPAARARTARLHKERWWALEDAPDLDAPPRRAGRALPRAAARRGAAAAGARRERPAFTLSGGMDSSSVLASRGRSCTGERQHAFSTLYSGSEYDESEEIRSMLDARGRASGTRCAVDAPGRAGARRRG